MKHIDSKWFENKTGCPEGSFIWVSLRCVEMCLLDYPRVNYVELADVYCSGFGNVQGHMPYHFYLIFQ